MLFGKILWAHTHARAKLDIQETDGPVVVRRVRHLLNAESQNTPFTLPRDNMPLPKNKEMVSQLKNENSQGFETISKLSNLSTSSHLKCLKACRENTVNMTDIKFRSFHYFFFAEGLERKK